LLTLLLLKEYLATDYRDIIELIETMNVIKERINLDETPHFTTIQKFCQRLNANTFTRLLHRLMKMFYDWGERIPLYRCRFIRVHQLLCQPLLFMENRKTRKRFLKTSISVDTDHQINTGGHHPSGSPSTVRIARHFGHLIKGVCSIKRSR
jgi:hypothetical protein